jgi:replicative DNA helicase
VNAGMELHSKPVLPESPDTERTVLGAILLDCELLDEARSLDLAAFSRDSNRRVFRHMCKLADSGIKIDIVTLSESLAEANEISSIGGYSYLASLTEGMPRRLHIHEYVEIVREKHMRRKVIGVCTRYANKAADQIDGSVADLIASADQELLGIAADGKQDWPSVEVQTHAELERMHAQRAGKEVMGYGYGIPSLDRMIGGLVPREMTVLGGRPGQGKSSLIAQLVTRHCPKGIAVHVFSIEMSAGQFLRRLWAIASGVPFHKVRHPERQTPEETRLIIDAAARVSTWPLQIDDAAGITPDQLIARARMFKRRQETRIVAVDYLQKLRFPDKSHLRYLEVTAAAVAMAALAKEESLALLLLSSVSEKNGSNRNDPPTLQDFRQSGDIAYEASTALLIHREKDDATEKELPDGLIIVAKARSDETGAVAVRFSSDSLTFGEGGRG